MSLKTPTAGAQSLKARTLRYLQRQRAHAPKLDAVTLLNRITAWVKAAPERWNKKPKGLGK